MRTFVAVELGEPCRRLLAQAVETLRRVSGGVKWVEPESLHLTLKFIGEVRDEDVPLVIESLSESAAGKAGFTMHVRGLSGFPPKGKPRVVHVGLEESSGALAALQQAVEHGLANDLGIAEESRPFAAHVTLGRVKESSRCPCMEELSAALPQQDFGSVRVDSFVLMKSDLRPTGPIYTPVHRFPLKAG